MDRRHPRNDGRRRRRRRRRRDHRTCHIHGCHRDPARTRRRALAGGAAPTGCVCLRLRPGSIQRIGVSRAAAVVVIGGSFFAVLCRASRQLRLRNPGTRRFVVRDALVRIKAPAARRHLRCGRLAHCDPARSPLRRQQVRSPPTARPSPRFSRSDGMATPHVPRTYGPATELAGQHQRVSAAAPDGCSTARS